MKTLATIFAFAAVLVPTALAAPPQPLSDVQLTRASRVQQPDLIERYVKSHVARPAPDVLERYARTHAATPASDVQLSRFGSGSAAPAVESVGGPGFDWADFSIGAAAMLGAMLLATLAALGIRSARGRLQSA